MTDEELLNDETIEWKTIPDASDYKVNIYGDVLSNKLKKSRIIHTNNEGNYLLTGDDGKLAYFNKQRLMNLLFSEYTPTEAYADVIERHRDKNYVRLTLEELNTLLYPFKPTVIYDRTWAWGRKKHTPRRMQPVNGKYTFVKGNDYFGCSTGGFIHFKNGIPYNYVRSIYTGEDDDFDKQNLVGV